MNTLALLLLCINPQDDILRDRVDCIEVNHFYDEQGRLVFDQAIFYDWCRCQERYQVRAWRLIKHPGQFPVRNWLRGGGVSYSSMWQDGDWIRRVDADSVRETWTQYDPELAEREVLPKDRRRELSGGGRP